eukprot:g6642.t1
MVILKKDSEMLRVVLEDGRVLAATRMCVANPLVSACSSGFLEGVKILINHHADVFARDVNGSTCLLAAAKNKQFDIVSYLVESSSCDLNAIGNDGYNALHHIALLDESIMTEKLIRNGAYYNARTWDGRTAVHLAAKNGCTKSLKVLLEHEADPNIETEVSYTLISCLVEYATISVNDQKECDALSGTCALHEAVNEKRIEAVNLLLKHGAHIAKIRSDGLTPIDVALSLSPQRKDIIHSLLNVHTVNAEMKQLALRCKRTEQIVKEQQFEIADKTSALKRVEKMLKDQTSKVNEMTSRCKKAELDLKKTKMDLERYLTRGELAEESLKSLESNVGQSICCPITMEVMEDPVIAMDGHTYERKAMERWLIHKRESPVTRQATESVVKSTVNDELNYKEQMAMLAVVDDSIHCPITFEVMKDPVIAADGHTYERRAIEQWLRQKKESPVTRQPISSNLLTPNLVIKHVVNQITFTNKEL